MVIICNSVQSVRYSDHCGVLELGLDAVLDEVVGLHVDIGRGLVQHQELVLLEQGPRQAQQLLLAH